MTDSQPASRYRFGIFEADAATGELRRQGLRVKLNAQPFQVLCLLLERPGELLTRDEISRELWTDGTFVDYEHGVNSAINRIREALGDTASNPRFVETLARRGYRFVAPVERIAVEDATPAADSAVAETPVAEPTPGTTTPLPLGQDPASWILASPHELPETSSVVVQTLFLLLQLMYLGFYVGALANLTEIEDLLSILPHANLIVIALIVTAAILIPVRCFVMTAVIFRVPAARDKLLKVWRFLLPFDELWALSPFLLLHHINFGMALSCTAILVYSPFAQRSLILMGAGGTESQISPTAT
jgi:DNA-binding winged helix-turn-helix (wHTH) protein